MSLIGYDFPKEWGEVKITTTDRMLFRLQNIYKHFYWKCLRCYILNKEKKDQEKKTVLRAESK